MKVVHLVNGDSLALKLNAASIEGQIIVCREALIEGPLRTEPDDQFWQGRSQYIHATFNDSPADYQTMVRTEFQKLSDLKEPCQINLWFENDLFCQANYWFCIVWLECCGRSHQLFRVYPRSKKKYPGWSGFGNLYATDLVYCLKERVPLAPYEIKFGSALWNSYATSDFVAMRKLASENFPAFAELDQVVDAHIERFADDVRDRRPQRTLLEILNSGNLTFEKIFQRFATREGVYGFGDIQVRNLIRDIQH